MQPHADPSPTALIHHLISFVFPQIGIASFTLVPVRFCMSFILFLMACSSATINYMVLTLSQLQEPEREAARKKLLKLPILFLRGMLFVSGVDCIEHKGQDDGDAAKDDRQERDDASILLFVPHTSFFDLYPGIFLADVPSWVARAEAQNFLFFSNFLKLAGVIFVKRESDSSRKETMDLITKAATVNKIAICPEGTCGNGSKLLRFKTGAFSPGLPVQPMFVKYTTSSGLDTTSWTPDGLSFFTISWLTLCNLWTRIEVTKLPVYYPNDEERNDARLFADNVRKHIAQHTLLSTSPFIYDDVYFFRFAREANVPRTPICIKLLKIAHKTAVEREGTQRQELTAQTLGGLRSEDGNLLFAASRNSKHTENTLSVLREMTSSLKASLRLPDCSLTSPEDIADLTLKASSSRSLTPKSNAIHELQECLQGMDARVTLFLASALCDTSKPYLWDRVRECTDFLSHGTRTSLLMTDVRCLLWVLLGLSENQLRKLDNITTDVDFAFLRRNLRTLFPQAVNETIA